MFTNVMVTSRQSFGSVNKAKLGWRISGRPGKFKCDQMLSHRAMKSMKRQSLDFLPIKIAVHFARRCLSPSHEQTMAVLISSWPSTHYRLSVAWLCSVINPHPASSWHRSVASSLQQLAPPLPGRLACVLGDMCANLVSELDLIMMIAKCDDRVPSIPVSF